jgi:hypothetical protein
MSRLFGLALVALAAAAPARAADPPERLLAPTTQLYVRWDGVTPHKDAYKASVWGPVMEGPTGDSIRAILAKAPKLLGSDLLAGPLLEGKPPEELKAVHADLKHLEKVVDLLADKGILVAAEVRGPQPTLKGIGKTIGGLLGGQGPDPSSFVPEVTVFLIVPDVGDRADTLFAPTRLMLRNSSPGAVAKPFPAEWGVKGYTWNSGPLSAPAHMGEWVIDGHFVEYFGTVPIEQVIQRMKENGKTGGLTAHPLFARGSKLGETAGFESVARGFVDAKAVVGLAKRLAGPLVPGLAERVDAVGLGNLEAVVFSSGFNGKHSRALWEFDLPGERKGLAKVLKRTPLTIDDLPPMPPDVSRFAALRVDAPAAYDAGLNVVEALLMNQPFGGEEEAKTTAEKIQIRKEYLAREVDKALGLSVKDELLPHLGDKVVIFQAPVEGLSVFGTVVAISCKDPARVMAAADRLQRPIEAVVGGGQAKVRRKVYRGVEMREIYTRGFGILTPSYAVVGEWLVVAAHPQGVQGFILRHQGSIEKWKPDADVSARLTKMLPDAVGIQYCTPKSVVHNLCCIGPLFLSVATRIGRQFGNDSGDFDPLDVGLIPNGYELGGHLFPNLTVTRDDGKTLRVDVNESFGLPLEFAGLEVLVFAAFTGLGLF